jgi:excisionase family DNA binding protein
MHKKSETPEVNEVMRGRDIETILFYTTMEAAKILRVSTQTIRNYIYSGKIKSYRTPGGHHRVSKDDLQRLGFLKKK